MYIMELDIRLDLEERRGNEFLESDFTNVTEKKGGEWVTMRVKEKEREKKERGRRKYKNLYGRNVLY